MTTYVLTFIEEATKYAIVEADTEEAARAILRREHRAGNMTGVDHGDYRIVDITDVREDRAT